MMESKGKFRRKQLSAVEIEVARSLGYTQFAERAAAELHMKSPNGSNATLALFKCNGARIMSTPLTLQGQKKEWSLSNYLQLLKKNPSTVTIGVGFMEDSSSEEEQV